LIANINIVAVASLLEISAIIITENAQPNQETISRANMEEIVLLSTSASNFQVAGQLWDLGIKDH
jgi:predicted transcriptional regulator